MPKISFPYGKGEMSLSIDQDRFAGCLVSKMHHYQASDTPEVLVKNAMADPVNPPPEETIIDQWQSQIFARVLKRASIVFISDAPDDMVKDLHMIPAHTLEGALEIADGILAEKGIQSADILAIPDGVSVMVV